MENIEFNLPKITAFLFCNNIQQEVLSKNYELRGVFQGFGPPSYPFGAEFITFSRFAYEGSGELQIESLSIMKKTKRCPIVCRGSWSLARYQYMI